MFSLSIGCTDLEYKLINEWLSMTASMTILMDDILASAVRMAWFTSTIYKLSDEDNCFQLAGIMLLASHNVFEHLQDFFKLGLPFCGLQIEQEIDKISSDFKVECDDGYQTGGLDGFDPEQIEEIGLMHPLPKRARRGASSSIIKERANNHSECCSYLPNDILEKILGFLKIRKLVQLSTLAKQFRYAFRYGKRLDFDSSFHRALTDRDLYQSIVHQIMDQHNGPKIQSLKLCFTPKNNSDNQAMVAQWIDKAAQKGVEELELNFDRGLDEFRVAFDLLFQIKTLEAVRMIYVDLGSPIKDFEITGLQLLKVCSMKKLDINVVILDTLLKSCTRLEILEIIQCSAPDHIRFSAGNLSKFRKLKLANCITLREITIDAPSLTTLHYGGPLIAFNFENCDNCADFLLDLKASKWEIFCVDHSLGHKLVFNFLRTEVLTTTSVSLEVLCKKRSKTDIMDRFHSFPTVKEINLTMEGSSDCNLFKVDHFFSKFFHCERIFIDVRGWLQDIQPTSLASGSGNNALEQQQPLPVQWTPTHTILAKRARSYPRLEQLKLTGFRFRPNEMELLCYFLRSGHNLNTVAIFLAPPRYWRSVVPPDEDVLNHNLQPWIASPGLRIKIYEHKHEKKLYPTKHPKNWRKD